MRTIAVVAAAALVVVLMASTAEAGLKAGECEGTSPVTSAHLTSAQPSLSALPSAHPIADLAPSLFVLRPVLCCAAVCIKVVDTIRSQLDKKDLKNKAKVLEKIRAYCKTARDRENRFVWLMHAHDTRPPPHTGSAAPALRTPSVCCADHAMPVTVALSRQCYYVGGTEDAATGVLNMIADPFVAGLPTAKICEKTKAADLQVCELRYRTGRRNRSPSIALIGTIGTDSPVSCALCPVPSVCVWLAKAGGASGKGYAKEDLQKMRIGELKSILSDLGGECSGCSEKSDFVSKIVALQDKKKAAAGDKKEL
jgi:hypothetical protein